MSYLNKLKHQELQHLMAIIIHKIDLLFDEFYIIDDEEYYG